MSAAPSIPAGLVAADAERRPLLGPAPVPAPATPGDDDDDTNAVLDNDVRPRHGFRRNLGTLEAFAIVISIVIGSGIFTSPGAVDTNVPSPGAALGVWLVGGVLAWTGAATLAELGTALPGEGGVQPFLQYIYGDAFGFLAAWTWLVAVMPATLAILAIVFVESLSATVVGAGDSAPGQQPLSHKLLSVAVLAAVSLANSVSTRVSARLNNFFVAAKFAAIAAVVVAALAVVVRQVTGHTASSGDGVSSNSTRPDWVAKNWFAPRTTLNPDGSTTDWTQLSRWSLLGHYSAALYGALWAYSGWDKAIYVSAELAAPARQLPRAIHAALPAIVLCFLAANAAYYVLLPWNVVSTTDSIAVTAFARLLGPVFGYAAAVLVCIVVAGSLLGNSFVAGRMAVAAAHNDWIPSVFAVLGRVGRRPSTLQHTDGPPPATNAPVEHAAAVGGGPEDGRLPKKADATTPDAPIHALFVSAALAAVYVLLGNFRALLTFNGLGEFTFFFLTVLGALILRVREPDLARPYKPWVAAPVAFLLVSGFVVVRGAAFAPAQALVLVALWLLGLCYYWARQRQA
ncbi:Amino acid/polyamine transporter I [Niveomyces insectorum RCEF 264]|uniref:Amino acid/polyamine transporter I n=1 Tax=Niveomyces insectorum RCEF 264 TaxID=1081102 RepID=A0A167WF30_9HYPO|nr:Amino acid/polyamine transporter I [Niveomyces insectorum RCEF 264]